MFEVEFYSCLAQDGLEVLMCQLITKTIGIFLLTRSCFLVKSQNRWEWGFHLSQAGLQL